MTEINGVPAVSTELPIAEQSEVVIRGYKTLAEHKGYIGVLNEADKFMPEECQGAPCDVVIENNQFGPSKSTEPLGKRDKLTFTCPAAKPDEHTGEELAVIADRRAQCRDCHLQMAGKIVGALAKVGEQSQLVDQAHEAVIIAENRLAQLLDFSKQD